MPLFTLEHTLRYRYDRPVFVEPMVIRLRPRSDVTQQLVSHELRITPPPAGTCDLSDHEGNDVTSAWFAGQRQELDITARSTVRTLRSNPFDYLITNPAAMRLPMRYNDTLALQPYTERLSPSPEVDALVEQLLREVDHQTTPFLAQLAQRVYDTVEQQPRHEGDPYPPVQTLAQRQGSCRDLVMLFLDACRAVGLAARFVSGYYPHDRDRDLAPTLHAWSEVYLPGGGWRGYDPSVGLATADEHIALAAGPSFQHAAPTTGRFRGTEAKAVLEYDVKIHRGEVPTA